MEYSLKGIGGNVNQTKVSVVEGSRDSSLDIHFVRTFGMRPLFHFTLPRVFPFSLKGDSFGRWFDKLTTVHV
jgi:hypothetical protein